MITSYFKPSLLLAALVLLNPALATLDPIVIKGNKFFFKTNGTQFYIKGVAYQQDVLAGGASLSNATYNDPLADATACARDVPYLQQLGTNVIRTYAINPTQDHSQCMALLDSAGIYVISDLSEPSLSIDRSDPSWDVTLYTRYTAVIDSLANYTNVIGFFAGNEVTNNLTTTQASAFVRAAVRDSKAYIAAKGYRPMGVGYAADDDATVRDNMADYFNCGDASSAIDFWGYNIYEWCGDSSFTASGYDQRTAEFANYSVPSFFAEYGCTNIPGGAAARPFTEVQAIYGSDMDDVFSGGIVYMYFEESNDYGLVDVNGNTVSTLADFNALSSQIQSISPTGVNAASFTPTNTAARACPTIDADWEASTDLPPTPNQALCTCMLGTLSCQAKSTLSDEEIGSLFSQVCGYNNGAPCVGIDVNATSGVYGAYSMCSSIQKLSWAMNAYYLGEKSASTACDFGGNANIVKAASASGTCSALVAQAGASGTGSVTSSPTGTGSSSSASGSATGKKSAGTALALGNPFSASALCLMAYVLGAFITGVGMILL